MSLSDICSQQHQHDQQKLRKILLWGLLGSLGVHGLALSLSQFNLWQQVATDELTPIELIVTDSLTEPLTDEPEVLPDPTQPAELSTQTNDPEAVTASAPPRAAVVAPPATVRPPVEPVSADIPEPLEDTQAESALEEPQPTAEDEPNLSEEEPTETAEETPEELEPETVATEPTESQSERLRDLLQRLHDSQEEAGTSTAAVTTESATAVGGTVPNAPAGDSPGVAVAPSTTQGSGQGQGSRTVACQNCVRPNYPQSALAAGAEGQPMVSVDINPDGSVRSVTLTRSSGNPAIDQAAIQAARNSRFQPVAGGASVPIEYDLTIEGSRRNRDARRRGERQAVEVPTPPSSETTPATAESTPAPAQPSSSPETPPATPDETPAETPIETLDETSDETSDETPAPPPTPAPPSEAPAPAPAAETTAPAESAPAPAPAAPPAPVAPSPIVPPAPEAPPATPAPAAEPPPAPTPAAPAAPPPAESGE